MAFVFFVIGAVMALLFILNNLYRTVTRRKRIVFIEILLAFFAVLMPITGLLLDNQTQARFDLQEQLTLLIIIPMFIIHIGLTVVEAFRPRHHLRQSRGLLGIGMAILLLIANFSYNFIALDRELAIASEQRRPTPVNAIISGVDPCEAGFRQLASSFLQRISESAGLTIEELFISFEQDQTITIASLVESEGGNPNDLVQALVDDSEPVIQNLIANECLPRAVGAVLISQFETIVNQLIGSTLSENANFFGGFGGPPGAEEDTEAPTVSAADQAATRSALIESLAATSTPTPSPSPTLTPSITPSPTVTRTPFPTLSPTATRERFATPSPSPSPTLPNPCLAVANFNVNLRSLPDEEESEVVTVIPFEAVFSVFASNADQTWWFAQYEGEAGWISGEFISLTNACSDLPVRRP